MARGWLIGTVVLSLLVAARAPAQDGVFSAGRDIEEGRDFSVGITAGQITSFDAVVQETTRAYYSVVGRTESQLDAENYSLNDFDMDEGCVTLGLSMEKMWKFFTLQVDAAFMQPDTDTVARRNYYIEVGDVVYNGRSYDHMKIPEGTPFSVEATAGIIEIRGLFTLFTFRPTENVRLTPWIDLGIFGFGGDYDINAGPATGVVQYQTPLEDFVVGGQASGFGGLGLPEYGLGGEVRIGNARSMQLVLSGHYAMCEYEGSTGFLTTNDHRDKDIDLDHRNVRLRCSLEFPLKSSRALTVGIQYQSIESDALISSSATDPTVILARGERFDKEVHFEMESLQAMVGLTF